VPFSAYGANLREGQASMNRPMLLKQLGEEWIPTMPDVHARLLAAPPALIADVGCGRAGRASAWRAATRAQSCTLRPRCGFRHLANHNIHQAGLQERVQVFRRDGKASIWSGVTTWWLPSSASTTCPIRSGCCYHARPAE